jgi:hypothetical protein
MEFFRDISQNKYQYQPLTRETKFGTLDNPMALTVYYEGQEKINTTLIGALKTTFKVTDAFTLKFIGSIFIL